MYATSFCVLIFFVIIGLIFCENECGLPPEVDRAIISNPSNAYVLGSTVNYRCDYGFVSGGVVSKSRCVRDSVTNQPVWTVPEFTCNPRSCGDPGSVENARRVGTLFTFPNDVEYICNKGYRLSGSHRRYCEASGSWSGRLPTCNVVSCGRPADPEHGRAVYTSLTYDSELRYECNKDLQLSSKEPRYCGSDEQWTGTQPVCQEIECKMPEEPDFGSVELVGDELKVGSIVIYKCDSGRRLIGSRSSKCLKSGEWSFPAPLCTEPCKIPSVQHGELGKYQQEHNRRYGLRTVFKKVNVGTTIDENEEVILKCSASYMAKFSQYLDEITVTCRGGQFSPEPECVTTSCYDDPPRIENGEAVVRKRHHSSTIWYRCDSGFGRENSGQVRCFYGTWTGETPTCKDRRCHGDPPPVENATAVIRSRYHEASVKYVCDKGFENAKPSTIKCWHGSWNGTTPICKDTRCDKSSLNYPGLVRSEGFLFNRESFVPTCSSGYEITENRNKWIYCNAGNWTGNLPPCTRAQCRIEELEGLPGLVLEEYRALYDGDWLQPKCAAGFEFSNKSDSRLYCHEGGWLGNLPPCSPAGCSNPPPELENGKRKSPHATDHGSYVEYECLPSYDMDGTSSVRCNYGQWIGSPPTCKDSRCYLRNLHAKEGVNLTDDGPTHSGLRANIVCIGGYYLRYEVYCESGVWKTKNLLSPCQESRCYLRNLREKEGVDLTDDRPTHHSQRADIVCLRGYSLTYPNVYCDNGKWKTENLLSPCQEDNCEIEAIPNGKILKERSVSTEYIFGAITRTKTVREAADIGSTESTGAVLYVECNARYKFQGEEKAGEQVSITCRRGKWTPLPVCLQPYCFKEPPTPENGKINLIPSFHHGSSVEYACLSFYKMHGNSSVVCNNGSWTGTLPTCKDRRCYIKDLLEKEGVDLKSDIPIYPSYKAKIVCIRGYSLKYPEVYCEEGVWKTENLLSPCQKSEKPLETEIPNAGEEVTSVPLSVLPSLQPSKLNASTIKDPSTNHSIVISGQESYSANSSVKEDVDAGLVTLDKNSTTNKVVDEKPLQVEIPNADKEVTSVPLTILPSLQPSKSNDSTKKDSAWIPLETEIPNAGEVTSIPLTVISTLQPSGSSDSSIKNPSTDHSIIISGQESDSVEEDLDGGLVMLDKSSTVNEVAVVTDAMVNPPCSCEYPVHDHLLVAHDGKKQLRYKDQILSGSTISFYCKDRGYFRLRGRLSLTCPSDCLWHSSMFPSCAAPTDYDVVIRIISNPEEKVGPGGVLSVIPGTRLELICYVKSGYPLQVDWTIVPGYGSKYTGSAVGYSFIIWYVVEKVSPQDSGKYICYNVHGQSHSVYIEVEDIECPEIELTEGLVISYAANRKFDSQAQFSCHSPYVRNGPSCITCEASGVWSGPPASCQLPTCSIGSIYDTIPEGVIPLIDEDIDENVPFGYELRLGCDEKGTIFKGDNTATCGAEGLWRTEGYAQCVKGCTGLPKKNYSELVILPNKEFYSMGESIIFLCPKGKNLTTEVERILCFSSGWTPDIINVPDCK